MTPDFALSLSFDGIRLTRRTAEGWTLLGEVPLDSSDLAGGLAGLRRAGLEAGVPWRGTKLVLPAEQVKELTLEGEFSEEEVRAALDGTTPYPVAELVVARVVEGGRTHVAAVARETLEEAKAFAAGHGFQPVSFAAPWSTMGPSGEAEFGPARDAAAFPPESTECEPTEASAITADDAQGDGPESPSLIEDGAPEGAADLEHVDRIGATAEVASAPEVPPLVMDEAPSGTDELSSAAPADAEAPFLDIEPSGPETAPAAMATPPLEPVEPLFAPLLAAESPEDVQVDPSEPESPAESDGAAGNDPSRSPAPGARPLAAQLSATGVPEPIFASRARPLRGQTREGATASPPRAAAPKPGARIEPPVAQAGRGATAEPAGWALSAPATGRPDPRVPPRVAIPSEPQRREPRAAPPPRSDVEAVERSTPEATPAAEAARMTVFGVRRQAPPRVKVGGKPRHLALMLTLALLAVMAAAALLAAVSPGSLAGLLRTGPASEVAEAPAALSDAPPAAVVPPSGGDMADASSNAPEATPEVAVAVAPSPEALVTGSEPPLAPAAEEEVAASSLAPLDPEDAEAAAAAVAAALSAMPSAVEGSEPADAAAAPPAVGSGVAVSPVEADRVYAATGVWLRAPRLLQLPEGLPGESSGPALAPVEPGKALAEAPILAALNPDQRPGVPFDPPPAGDTFARDERGLILATPEGTLAPSGVLLFAGSPPLLPPSRPGDGMAAAESAPSLEAATPGWINAMAEPPSRRPPLRPEVPAGFGSAAAPADALEAAGSESAPAVWVNAMAASPAAEPPDRPEFAPELLAALLPSAPDGTAVPEGALAFVEPADGAEATLGGVGLAALRPGLGPELRPEGLAPEGEPAAEPEVRVLTSYDGPGPAARPEGLAPETPDVADALAEALASPEAPAEETRAAPDLQSTLAAIVEGAPDPLAGASRLAVAAARVPEGRPRNFDGVVRDQLARLARAAQPAQPAQGGGGGVGTANLEANEAAEAAEVASAAAAVPSGPTATTVAAAATFADAMALREINLIGVYGQPGARRALIRMGNGRYLRVGVGDSLDGGQVTVIGDNALNYVRRGRTEVLVIPGG